MDLDRDDPLAGKQDGPLGSTSSRSGLRADHHHIDNNNNNNNFSNERARRDSESSGAPTDDAMEGSSEAETVILPASDERPAVRKKIKHKRKKRNGQVKRIEDSDEDKPRQHSRSSSPNIAGHSSGIQQPMRKDGKPIRDASGRLLLQKYCDKGDLTRARQLLEGGSTDVNDRDYAGNTAIHDAALKGHARIVEALLDHGAIIDIRSGLNDLDTPLIDACSRGQLDVVRLLLERGADPRVFNAQGKTALDSIPSDDPNMEVLEKMLKDQAYKFRAKARRDSAASAGSGDNEEIDNATNFDPSKSVPGTFPEQPREDKDATGSSTSTQAKRRGGVRGQSIRNDLLWMDLTTRTGRDMVYRKAADGDIQYVGRSLEEGWQPDGDCLVLAAKHGHTELVSLLLAFGAQSDWSNEDGHTALEQTIGRGHLDTVKLLLKSGANPLKLDHKGRSYYDIAREAVGSDDEEAVVVHDAIGKAKSEGKRPEKRSGNSEEERRMKKRKLKREDSIKRETKKIKPERDDEKRLIGDEERNKRLKAAAVAAEEEEIERKKRKREKQENEERERRERVEQEELEQKARERAEREEQEREAAKEEERKRREALEAQKERDRREREKKMLKNLEAEEKRKEEKRKLEQQQLVEQQEREKEERERQQRISQEQEEERRRLAIQRREAEVRRNYPYGIRTASYGAQTLEMMQQKLPLLARSFKAVVAHGSSSLGLTNGTDAPASDSYFIDVQIGLLLGLQTSSIYQTYPDLTKKLVTDQEKTRIWTMVQPWICRPLEPFSTVPTMEEVIAERGEDRKRFNAMTFFWLKMDQVLEILQRDYPLAYDLYTNPSNVVMIDIDYDVDTTMTTTTTTIPTTTTNINNDANDLRPHPHPHHQPLSPNSDNDNNLDRQRRINAPPGIKAKLNAIKQANRW